MTRHRHLITLIGANILCWSFPALAQPGPRETIESGDRQIRELLSKQAPEGSPAAQARDTKMSEVVSNLLHLDHMAEKALGRYWRDRSQAERQEYLSLMRQLVERSYLRQARTRTEYEVQYVSADVDGDEAEVETNLRITTRGRREVVEILYTLKQFNGTWRVIDIETDGASTVRNYRAQFRRIIQRHGFSELISRMRSRLEAGESEL